jgi:GTP-binding protein
LGIINTNFEKFDIDNGSPIKRERGSLIASETGQSNLYGLTNIQERGLLFIGPGVQVYKGQVVGENSRSDDMSVNVTKAKALSNMRSKGDGGMEHFNVPKIMDLEDSMEFVNDDELVEVTPLNIRIRKKILDEALARRMKAQGLL